MQQLGAVVNLGNELLRAFLVKPSAPGCILVSLLTTLASYDDVGDRIFARRPHGVVVSL